MRIGIRAHDVAYAPLDELIPNIHKQGFHCMHIALSKSIKEFKPGVETMTPSAGSLTSFLQVRAMNR